MELHVWIKIGILIKFFIQCSSQERYENISQKCDDGCPDYPLDGALIPLDEPTSVSLWNNNILEIITNLPKKIRFEGSTPGIWYNITSTPRASEFCVDAPGLIEGSQCQTYWDSLTLLSNADTLWKFDCNVSDCGCHHHRLFAVSLPRNSPSSLYWWPGPNTTRLLISHSFEGDVGRSFPVPKTPKWHDIRVEMVYYRTVVRSSSLNIDLYEDVPPSVWVFGLWGNNTKEPSYFAMGCSDAPQGSPGTTPSIGLPGTTSSAVIRGLIVFASLLILILIVALALRLLRRSCRSPEASHHEPRLPLPLHLGSLPPLPRLLEENEEEEGEYWEIDEEALKMQLARERMGRTLLACSAESSKKEEEKDGKERAEEKMDMKNLEAYLETIARDGNVTEWVNPDYEPFTPLEEGEVVRRTGEKEEEDKEKNGDKKEIKGCPGDMKNVEAYMETIAREGNVTEWVNPDYEPFTPLEERGVARRAGEEQEKEKARRKTR